MVKCALNPDDTPNWSALSIWPNIPVEFVPFNKKIFGLPYYAEGHPIFLREKLDKRHHFEVHWALILGTIQAYLTYQELQNGLLYPN